MSFVITVKADTRAAEGGVDRLQRKLDGLEKQTHRGRDALGRFTSSGAKGMDGVRASTDRASTSFSKASNAAGGLRGQIQGLIAAAGAYFGVTKAIEALDTYTNIENRLRGVAKDQANLNGLMAESFAIAQRTRVSWGTVGESIARFDGALKGLGVTQRDTLAFTETLGKSMQISGATTSEASAALFQLTQALGKGVLNGEEFNSQMENNPTLMRLVAKELGVTMGALKDLGSQMKITAKVMYDTVTNNRDAIERAFGQTVPTIAQGFTMLKNEAVKFFGEAGKGSGITKALGAAIAFLSANFETIAKVALGVGQALIGLYVIEKIIVLSKALTVAIAANPLGALLVALTVGIALLRQFGDSLSAGAGHAAKVGDVLRVLWQDLKALASTVVDFVENAWSSLTGAFSDGIDGTGIELSLKSVLMFIASFVDAAIGLFKFLGKSVITVFGGIPLFLGEVFVKLVQDIAKLFENMLNAVIDKINSLANKITNPLKQGVAAVAGNDFIKQRNAIVDAEIKAGRVRGRTGVGGTYTKEDFVDPTAWTRLEASFKAQAELQKSLSKQGQVFGRVDFSFDNPLEGAGKAVGTKFAEDWRDAVETSIAKDHVANMYSRADDMALGRKAAGPGYISDARGKKDPTAPTKEAEAAAKRLTKELEALTKQSNPLVEAEMKFAHAVDVTGRALDAKRISVEGANTILTDLATQLHAARFPFEAWVTEIRAETDALSMSAGERERANEIRRVENDLRQKGLEIGDDIRADIAREIDAFRARQAAADAQQRAQSDLQSALDRIKGPSDEYNQGLSIARQLMADNAITAVQYQQELDRLTDAYRDATDTGRGLQDGLSRGWRSIVDDMTNVADAAESAFVNAFSSIEDAIVGLATTGKFEWKSMINSMLADMTRLLLKQAFSEILSAFSPNIPAGAPQLAYPGGYATGGSFMVRGGGGTDSVPVSFWASPGERVTVATQSEQKREAQESKPDVKLKIVNTIDSRDMVSAMDSPEGERVIVNAIRKHFPGHHGAITGRTR